MNNMVYPRYNSENILKNGNTIYDKPKFMCKDCRKHFVRNPVIQKISDEKKELMEKNPALRNLSGRRRIRPMTANLY